MLAEDRRSYILNLLGTRSSVTVAELSAAFGLSEVSVRKLLSNMEQEGVIKRTWGGAVSAYGSLREFSHKEKEPICLAEKQSIARAAYHCIADGDAVFLDCGTTTAQLARLIRNGKKRNLMVATTGLNIAMELADADDISVIVIGGELRHMLSPQLFFLLITISINSFKVFDTIKVMTDGGPGNATDVISLQGAGACNCRKIRAGRGAFPELARQARIDKGAGRGVERKTGREAV